MSALALKANHAVADRAGAALLRSPLPVWGALFFNVLAFAELPTLVPIPTIVGQLLKVRSAWHSCSRCWPIPGA